MNVISPQQQEAEFVRLFKVVNSRLLDWGWMFGGLMSAHEVIAIEDLFRKLDRADITQDREYTLNEINELMLGHVFALSVRAYTVFRAREARSTAHVSHHVDRATFHYYKRDFFSCVLTLLPAIEGILLARLGWTPTSGLPKPTFSKLIKCLEQAQIHQPGMATRFEMHRDVLVAYLRRWIFQNHADMETDVCYLNRHYALHCMGSGGYYSAADCHRLFTFLDVYLDLLGYETTVGLRAFIPDKDPFVSSRIKHYSALILGTTDVLRTAQQEEIFMREHSAYNPEPNPPEWQAIAIKQKRKMDELLAEIRQKMDVERHSKD